VVIVDGLMADMWTEAIRGMCGVPVARYKDSADLHLDPGAPVALVADAIASIRRVGRVPVLLAADEYELAPFASEGTVTHPVQEWSTMDEQYLLGAPGNVGWEYLSVYLWTPARSS
jgi:hypothetical protein